MDLWWNITSTKPTKTKRSLPEHYSSFKSPILLMDVLAFFSDHGWVGPHAMIIILLPVKAVLQSITFRPSIDYRLVTQTIIYTHVPQKLF